MTTGYHPYTWLAWLAASATAALLTRNPFYLAILIGATSFVYAALTRHQKSSGVASAAETRTATWKPVLKLALALMLFTVLFNALTVHHGRYVLFTLPEFLPLIGGPITLEAVLYGMVIGLGFFALILVFSTFNSAVGPQTLLRLVPNFAHQAGVALTIAISFIPETLIAWREIREAQRLRGYRVRKLRDLQPLFVSLLGIGLDRAIQLAESMDARGFGGNLSAPDRNERLLTGAGTVAGLILLLAGLLTRSFGLDPAWLGLALLAGGAIILIFVFRRQGQRLQRSNYRRWFWRTRDTIVFLIMAATLVTLVALTVFFPKQLFYYPYPPYPLLPDFNPLLGLFFALPLMPALLLPVARRGDRRGVGDRKGAPLPDQ
jgi:energy-coupling factor transport system permease protein